MSNSNLIQRMREALDQFEEGRISPRALETSFETFMDGLQRIRSAEVHSARRLIGRLVTAHFLDGEVWFGDPQDVGKVLSECRQFVDSLPGDEI